MADRRDLVLVIKLFGEAIGETDPVISGEKSGLTNRANQYLSSTFSAFLNESGRVLGDGPVTCRTGSKIFHP